MAHLAVAISALGLVKGLNRLAVDAVLGDTAAMLLLIAFAMSTTGTMVVIAGVVVVVGVVEIGEVWLGNGVVAIA